MKHLLIVCNTPSENTRKLAQHCVAGAQDSAIEAVTTRFKVAPEATVDDVLWADGIIIGTTENFGAMSGLIKDFFERIYYPCLELKQGLPYALYIRAGLDGTGTRVGVEKIITGLRWREIHAPVLLKGDYADDFTEQTKALGLYMAAGLDNHIF